MDENMRKSRIRKQKHIDEVLRKSETEIIKQKQADENMRKLEDRSQMRFQR